MLLNRKLWQGKVEMWVLNGNNSTDFRQSEIVENCTHNQNHLMKNEVLVCYWKEKGQEANHRCLHFEVQLTVTLSNFKIALNRIKT